ncbi:MAG: hypothetical protein A2Y40_05785 [Candidatus Margulisbacteria bacterium GWF2_35_9]|nr:MAG: hypothetical protein A2Y40_05785 [Candidatus Margulisbacteria bacterium GWF2_35_9]
MVKLIKFFIFILVLGVTIAFTLTNMINIGSPKSEVTRIMGAPQKTIQSASSETWFYDESSITFKNEKVAEWSNLGNLKISIGTINQNAAPIKCGSTKDQVIAAMGTPSGVINNTNQDIWFYEASSIIFINGKISSLNNKGNLFISETDEEYKGPDFLDKEKIIISNKNAQYSTGKIVDLFNYRSIKGCDLYHLAASNSYFNKYGSPQR